MPFDEQFSTVLRAKGKRVRSPLVLRECDEQFVVTVRDPRAQKRLAEFCRATGSSPGSLLRQCLWSILGLDRAERLRAKRRIPRRIATFYGRLSQQERRLIESLTAPRTLRGWLADAVFCFLGQRHLRWSTCAEAALVARFGRGSREEVARLLPGHPPGGIVERARRLGLDLTRESWSAFATITRASARAGLAPDTLRAVLAAEEITPETRLTSTPGARPRARKYVHLPTALAAVRRHLDGETVTGLAHRLGRSVTVVLRAAEALGFARPTTRYWRLQATQALAIERRLAERETIPAAARRLGVEPATLWTWLREAGELGTRAGQAHALAPRIIDRVVAARRASGRRCSACGVRGHRRTTCPTLR